MSADEEVEIDQQLQRNTRFAPPEEDNSWVMPTGKQQYHYHLANLMNFFHEPEVKYTKNSVFTRSELLELNPTVIRRWLTMKAYNKEVYNPDVDAPTEVRSSTIANAKKFVSFFMPNKTKWVNGVGNPTRHASVNKVISDVKKAEVRRRGKADCSKRPLTEKEFRKTLEIFKKKSDWKSQILYPTMCLWQFTLIGRNDDICHFEVEDPRGHPIYNFALSTRVRWSKNISEERNCPNQIILGSMDNNFCILIQLAIYLESFLYQYLNAHYLFTEDTSERAVTKLKN